MDTEERKMHTGYDAPCLFCLYPIRLIKLNMQIKNIKRLLISGALFTISLSTYTGWYINDWVDSRDNMLIQQGYDKAIDEINLANKDIAVKSE